MAPAESERSGVTYGYARVSTTDQHLDLQLQALATQGIPAERIHVDYASGSRASRPSLDELLARLEQGDVLTVWKLDRLGRSVTHLSRMLEEMRERGIHFRSLTEGLDTSTPAGRAMWTIVAAFAELEREQLRERTIAGLEAARARRGSLGRPTRVTKEQYDLIMQGHASGEPDTKLARMTGLHRSVVGRVRRGEIASIRHYAQDAGAPPTLTFFQAREGDRS
ncbi:recombinase family protein [Corynebacterium variabile]|uniref:recombinase family protein n=1 Tax=Corynebacterium variabile TaxID=1727 RepID=UPI0028ABB7F6|nr:recombinase family protein [Dietzia maris]